VSSSAYSDSQQLKIIASKSLEQSATIEIAHEILLSSWDVLKSWLEQEKEAIILKNWLTGETRRWQKIRSEDKSKAREELLKGSRLDLVVEFRQKDAFKNIGGLRAEENEFIDASVEWQKRILQQEKRQNMILRLLLAGVGTAFVIAVCTSFYAFQQATIAGLGEQSAQARLKAKDFEKPAPIKGLVMAIKLTGESQKRLHRVLDSVRFTLSDLLTIPVESNIFTGHKKNVTSVASSPNGQYIASGSEDNTVRLWDLEGNPVSKPLRGHTDYVNSIAFSSNGHYIVTGSRDETVRLWNLEGDLIKVFEGHQNEVLSVAFSRDDYIVSAGHDGMLLWDLKGNLIQSFSRLVNQRVNSVAFSPDGKTIASAAGTTVKFWDRQGNLLGIPVNKETGEPIEELHAWAVNSVAFSPDGKYLATNGNDNFVKLLDLKTKTVYKTFSEEDSIDSVSFDKDSQHIAIVGGKTVRVRGIEGELIGDKFFRGHQNNITSVAWSPVAPYIVTGSWDKTVRLWDRRQLIEQLPNSEDSQALLEVACNRLFSHAILVTANTEEAKAAGGTCQTEVWNKTQNAEFLVKQGRKIAQQGDLQESVAKFKQALRLDPNLDINPEEEAQRLSALAQSENEENSKAITVTPPKIPNQATYGQVTLSEFTLNNKGNVVNATPGEKINVSANYIYDCPECQRGAINQIIVGIAGENSAQACIYNGGIQGSSSNQFTLTAPNEPGIYDIRFRYAQAYGCEQGALDWWRVDGEPTAEANIGAIVVEQGGQAEQ
nr:hypothetical protein [Pleurocapsa sp. MO_226.B13]